MDNNNFEDDDSSKKSNNRDTDVYLKHVTKVSQKISKASRRSSSSSSSASNEKHEQQPAVYNVSKSEFRDVVERLTGSGKSRLEKIRPPPLPQIRKRAPEDLITNASSGSPLPPFPSVHASAESPISAYMRFYHNSLSSFPPLSPKSVSSPTQTGH